jgi:hypothetical protein
MAELCLHALLQVAPTSSLSPEIQAKLRPQPRHVNLRIYSQAGDAK